MPPDVPCRSRAASDRAAAFWAATSASPASPLFGSHHGRRARGVCTPASGSSPSSAAIGQVMACTDWMSALAVPGAKTRAIRVIRARTWCL